MTNKIQLLSEHVASQIAAGEVIERPASIIKELLENSIDAGSNNITVIIKRSGNSLISVSDNGSGIGKEDLPMAICQHATSKLATLADLEAIQSLGFRGEALASICSVAKVKIISKLQNAAEAWSLEMQGDTKLPSIVPAAHASGTTIEVRDLFFNIPVRRRFLKSLKTEYQHILEIFQKIALSKFDVAFKFISDDKVIYRLPKADGKFAKDNRVKKILGSGFIQDATYFESSAAGISVHGWLGAPSHHRSQSDQQYFFLNNRIIRDKLIIHAIKFVYDAVIPNGRQPCYVLYLNIDPSSVDINVHPTKHEVRFSEPRWVHQFIVQQLTKVLLNDSSLALDHDLESDGNTLVPTQETVEILKTFDSKEHKVLSNIAHSNPDYDNKKARQNLSFGSNILSAVGRQSMSKYLQLATLEKLDINVSHEEIIDNIGKIVIDFNNDYIISSYNHNYYLVDWKKAYAFLANAKLSVQWQNHQKLLSTEIIIQEEIPLNDLYAAINGQSPLSSKDFIAKLKSVLDLVKVFGFDFKSHYQSATQTTGLRLSENLEFLSAESGEVYNTLLITRVPTACRFAAYQDIFTLVIKHLINHATYNTDTEQLFQQLAMRSMTRLQHNILPIERQALLDKLTRKEYNELEFAGNVLVKKLSAGDFARLLTV